MKLIKRRLFSGVKGTKKIKVNKKVFYSFLITASIVLFVISFMFEMPASIILSAIALAVAMSNSIYSGIRKVKEKNIFNMDLAVSLSSVILFCFGGFQQAVCCMLIYSIGMLILERGIDLRLPAEEICSIIKEKKYHRIMDRESVVVSSDELESGDFVELFSGEYVPVDGYVKAGSGTVSTGNITGDSKIETKYSGDYLMAGYTLLSGNIILEAKSDLRSSEVFKIAEILKKSATQKTVTDKIVSVVTAFLSVLTVILVLITAFMKFFESGDVKSLMYFIPVGVLFSQWELIRKVVSNSCIVGIYRLSKKGIIIKKKGFIEKNLFTNNVGFTVNRVLTIRSTKIINVYTSMDITEDELLKFAAYAQYKNESDVAKAIYKRADCRIKQSEISEYVRYEGDGSSIKLFDSIDILTGTSELLKSFDIISGVENDSCKLCVAINGNYVGYIEFENEIKQDLRQCMDSLRFAGVRKITVIDEGSVRTISEIMKRASLGRMENNLKLDEFMNMYDETKEKAFLFCSDEYVTDSEYISSICYDGSKNENAEAFTFVDSLAAPVNLFNVIKDIKALLVQNVFIWAAYKTTMLFMLFKSINSLWLCLVLLLITSLILKMNEIRFLKKI